MTVFDEIGESFVESPTCLSQHRPRCCKIAAMTDNFATRVVLHQTVLRGANDSNSIQRVATVYIDGAEYRVSAPPQATGDALDWVPHLTVRQLKAANSDVEVRGPLCALALQSVSEELEKSKRKEVMANGLHPDGIHCAAQICTRGHVQQCDGTPSLAKHCPKCGATCITECPDCSEAIRGVERYSPTTTYERPNFCPGCGRPYPWMQHTLRTARELLEHEDKLSLDERNSLLGDLQYVLADPKAELVAAKKRLIAIKLEKTSAYAKEFFTDLIAKIAVESMKG